MLNPEICEKLPVDHRLLHPGETIQIHHLQFKIVIGKRLVGHRVVPGEGVGTRIRLPRSAENAADCFSQPAAQYLFSNFVLVLHKKSF